MCVFKGIGTTLLCSSLEFGEFPLGFGEFSLEFGEFSLAFLGKIVICQPCSLPIR
jgi:hypothetical protein